MPNRNYSSFKIFWLVQACCLQLLLKLILISANSQGTVEVLVTDVSSDNQPIIQSTLNRNWAVPSSGMQMIKPTVPLSSQQSSRHKRQAFRTWGGKRTEYENEELDEQLENDSQNNRKKSKTFVAWGGKRSQMSPLIALQSPIAAEIASGQTEDLSPALKRFRAWGGKKRSEKPFRTWGGKRSFNSNFAEQNGMLSRLQQLGSLPIYQEIIASHANLN